MKNYYLVYSVIENYDYCCFIVEGLFSSIEKAENYIKKQQSIIYFYKYTRKWIQETIEIWDTRPSRLEANEDGNLYEVSPETSLTIYPIKEDKTPNTSFEYRYLYKHENDIFPDLKTFYLVKIGLDEKC